MQADLVFKQTWGPRDAALHSGGPQDYTINHLVFLVHRARQQHSQRRESVEEGWKMPTMNAICTVNQMHLSSYTCEHRIVHKPIKYSIEAHIYR